MFDLSLNCSGRQWQNPHHGPNLALSHTCWSEPPSTNTPAQWEPPLRAGWCWDGQLPGRMRPLLRSTTFRTRRPRQLVGEIRAGGTESPLAVVGGGSAASEHTETLRKGDFGPRFKPRTRCCRGCGRRTRPRGGLRSYLSAASQWWGPPRGDDPNRRGASAATAV